MQAILPSPVYQAGNPRGQIGDWRRAKRERESWRERGDRIKLGQAIAMSGNARKICIREFSWGIPRRIRRMCETDEERTQIWSKERKIGQRVRGPGSTKHTERTGARTRAHDCTRRPSSRCRRSNDGTRRASFPSWPCNRILGTSRRGAACKTATRASGRRPD
jgi:hypothetical protein